MDDTELAAAVRAASVFADLSDESVAFLVSSATREIFAPQDVIVRQGALDEDAVLIVAGEAIVTSDSAHGEIPVSTVRGPALVGEIGAIARLPRTATVRARSEVLALRIAREDLMRVAEATPSMLVGVISRLGDRIGRMGNAIALYTHALAALERQDAEANVLLEELRNPIPDLADFAETFSRIAEQILLRRQRSDEMAAAAIVQRALLPNAEDFASETGVDIAAAMTPARDIGGDFFDLMKLEDGRIALGIGDVCGKGVPAALFMGITKSLIRINLREKPDLPGAIARANAFLINNNASDQFATALYAALDPATGEVEYCSCGHNAAFIRREGGTVESAAWRRIADRRFRRSQAEGPAGGARAGRRAVPLHGRPDRGERWQWRGIRRRPPLGHHRRRKRKRGRLGRPRHCGGQRIFAWARPVRRPHLPRGQTLEPIRHVHRAAEIVREAVERIGDRRARVGRHADRAARRAIDRIAVVVVIVVRVVAMVDRMMGGRRMVRHLLVRRRVVGVGGGDLGRGRRRRRLGERGLRLRRGRGIGVRRPGGERHEGGGAESNGGGAKHDVGHSEVLSRVEFGRASALHA